MILIFVRKICFMAKIIHGFKFKKGNREAKREVDYGFGVKAIY